MKDEKKDHNAPIDGGRSFVNLYSLAWPVSSLGPGCRVVMWVAGCRKRCPGCISPEMLDPASGRPVPVDVLERRLLRLEESLAGVTISGGEPFDQAEELADLLERVRAKRPNWSVIIYSGYALATLRRKPLARRLLELADVLIDGPYRRGKPQSHPLAGSGNQRIRLISARGRAMRPELEACPPQPANFGLGPGLVNMIIGVPGAAGQPSLNWIEGEGFSCDT
ncbi:MAG TPA: 4Fe-4S single cluster domain-containing protein [Candidatus Bathyarchaeia archaeon]|nr:4Fe-4S single cluster domain-containing protein [Candidatus Bathyarchaeia archaeon]